MKLKTIFTFIFALVAVIFEAYFWVFSLVSFFIQIILIAVVVSMFFSLFRIKGVETFGEKVKRLTLITAAIIGFFLSLFLSFVAYHNFFPGKLSDITVSNGKQTIIFLQMSHIATADFYAQKQSKISELANTGYTLLMEWVRPGTPENEKRLSESLGFDFTPTLYTTVASFIGLTAQDNSSLFASVSSGSLVSVDISIDEIMTIMGTGSLPTVSGEVVPPVDIESSLATFQNVWLRERNFAGWVVRSLLNLTLKQMATFKDVMMLGADPRLFDAILTKRNDAIIQYIRENPDKKIAIVYGGLHFEWVFSALQSTDPTWKILSIDSYTPYNE
jgi:hypothetical protein